MTNRQKLAVRINRRNANHHLWKNNGTWWCHFTIHSADFTKQRVRLSLETHKIDDARRRRDDLLSTQEWPLTGFARLALIRGIE
jgi:hypothetical protein